MAIDIGFLAPAGALTGALFACLLDEREIADTLPAGITVGNFRLGRLLGRGGSGAVYEAHRNDGAFQQSVALKIVRSNARQRDFIRRERNHLGMLDHPGIARILDGGETADGQPWYAMELVVGRRIDAYCDGFSLDWRQRAALMVQVCDAVQYAHTRLIAHRDLKPSNILIDDSGRPRLLDFGLSRTLNEATLDAGTVAFTPGYASPEQLRGEAATAATDIFQLGCLLNALVMEAPGSSRLPRTLTMQVAACVDRATNPDATQRYASAADLGLDLQRLVAGFPVRACVWPWYQHARWFVGRHRWPAATAALSLALASIATVHYATALSSARDRAEGAAHTAEISNEVLSNLFRAAAPNMESAQQLSAAEVIDRSADSALRRLTEAPLQRATAIAVVASTYLDLGGLGKARTMLDTALAELDQHPQELRRERARLHVLRARAALGDRDVGHARVDLDLAAQLLTGMDERTSDMADLESARIQLLLQQGVIEQANAQRETLIATMAAQQLDHSALFANLLVDRANARSFANDYEGAKADAERALDIARARFGPTSPQSLRIERTLIWISVGLGQSAAADRLVSAQYRSVLASLGPKSQEFADVLGTMGTIAFERGDLGRARGYFQQSRSILLDRVAPDSLELIPVTHNLADVLLQQGDAKAALEFYESTLRIRLQHFHEINEPIVVNRLQIARAQCELGSYAQADAGFADARRSFARLVAPEHPYLTIAAASQAECLLRQHRVVQARAIAASDVSAQRIAALTGNARARAERITAQIDVAVAATRRR